MFFLNRQILAGPDNTPTTPEDEKLGETWNPLEEEDDDDYEEEEEEESADDSKPKAKPSAPKPKSTQKKLISKKSQK